MSFSSEKWSVKASCARFTCGERRLSAVPVEGLRLNVHARGRAGIWASGVVRAIYAYKELAALVDRGFRGDPLREVARQVRARTADIRIGSGPTTIPYAAGTVAAAAPDLALLDSLDFYFDEASLDFIFCTNLHGAPVQIACTLFRRMLFLNSTTVRPFHISAAEEEFRFPKLPAAKQHGRTLPSAVTIIQVHG